MGTINKTQPAQVLCNTQCSYASITAFRLIPAYSLKLVSEMLYNVVLDITFSKPLHWSKYLCLLILNCLDVQ